MLNFYTHDGVVSNKSSIKKRSEKKFQHFCLPTWMFRITLVWLCTSKKNSDSCQINFLQKNTVYFEIQFHLLSFKKLRSLIFLLCSNIILPLALSNLLNWNHLLYEICCTACVVVGHTVAFQDKFPSEKNYFRWENTLLSSEHECMPSPAQDATTCTRCHHLHKSQL